MGAKSKSTIKPNVEVKDTLDNEFSLNNFLLFKKELEKLKKQIILIDATLEGVKVELTFLKKKIHK